MPDKKFAAIFTRTTAGTRTENQIKQALRTKNFKAQYDSDIAFWYGTLTDNLLPAHVFFFQRVFTILHLGKLCYKNNQGIWVKWKDSGIPIASSVSHGGRVMIQLPNNAGETKTLWKWLWTGLTAVDNQDFDPNVQFRPPVRASATHGIGNKGSERMPAGCGIKKIVELKYSTFSLKKSSIGHAIKDRRKQNTGKPRHFGLNIALGGSNNINPFSYHKIIPNGSHGHFYVFYKRPKPNKHGGLLFGCEGSCPTDMAQNDTETGRWMGKSWPKDQTGHLHTIGSSGTYSPTGGKKWKDMSWHPAGPKSDMFIDLSNTNKIRQIMKADFDIGWIKGTGV